MEVTTDIIYQSGPYEIFVGRQKDDEPLHYMVRHSIYQVVEYETEVFAGAIAWAQHFEGELKKLLAGEPADTTTVAQNVLPFGKQH